MTSSNLHRAEPRTPRRAWTMLIAITMLNVVGMTVVLPVLPFVVARYVPEPSHLAIWVGVLETVNALCAFLVAPLFGGLSDRFGRRPVIVLASFGAAIGFATFGIGGSIWVLLAGRIIQGITAGDMPALFAYAADITPAEQRAKRFGLLGALAGIGFMIGPALGGLLAAVDVDLPVFVTAGIALLVAVLSFFLLPESLKEENRTPTLQLEELHPVKVFSTAFARPTLRGLLIALILIGVPFSMFVNNFSVLAIDQLTWSATQIGLLTAAIGVLDIAIQGGLMQFLLPRIGERGVIVAGVVTQALGLGALAVVGSILAQPWLLIVGTLALGAGQGPATAAMDGVLSNQAGDHEQGWIAGVMQSLNTGVNVLAPVLAGVLYAGLGHSVPYWAGLAMMIGAVVVLSRVRFASPSKRTPSEPASNGPISGSLTAGDPTSGDPTSGPPTSVEETSVDRASDDPTATAPAPRADSQQVSSTPRHIVTPDITPQG